MLRSVSRVSVAGWDTSMGNPTGECRGRRGQSGLESDWAGAASSRLCWCGRDGAVCADYGFNAKRTRVWRDLSHGATLQQLVCDAQTGGRFLRGILEE